MADDSHDAPRPGETLTSEILEALSEGFCVFDRDWRLTYANRAAEAQIGLERQATLGRTYWELVPHAVGSPLEPLLRRAMEAREPFEVELPSLLRPGVVIAIRGFPLQQGLGLSFRDVTEQHARLAREREQAERVEQALAHARESEARFRALADCAPAPVWITTAAGPMEFVNQAFAAYVGRPREALMGDVWLDLLHPDDIAGIVKARAAARGETRAYDYEARFKRHDGAWRLMQVSSHPRFDDHTGEFLGYVGIAADVTEPRAAEERQRLLINELNHRVKNTLATVQSLARQTLKDGLAPRQARDLFTARLMALSAAHNVLTRRNWTGAALAEVAADAVRPYDDPAHPRIALAGPEVEVAPHVALALSLALHELATNATKHGALSSPGGAVEVRWTLSSDGQRVDLTWREAGGPPVVAPTLKGFGSRLLTQGLTGELGAPAQLSWAPQGLVCTLRAPLGD